MKPMIILPPDVMSEENIKELRDNGICVVVAKDPAAIRFVDPIPAQSCRTEIENAAIQLSRKCLNGDVYVDKSVFARHFVEILTKGTPLDKNPTQAEVERQAYDQARIEECRRIAREEAREEAAARKVAKKGKTP